MQITCRVYDAFYLILFNIIKLCVLCWLKHSNQKESISKSNPYEWAEIKTFSFQYYKIIFKIKCCSCGTFISFYNFISINCIWTVNKMRRKNCNCDYNFMNQSVYFMLLLALTKFHYIHIFYYINLRAINSSTNLKMKANETQVCNFTAFSLSLNFNSKNFIANNIVLQIDLPQQL